MEASHDLVYVWLNKLDVDGQKKSQIRILFYSPLPFLSLQFDKRARKFKFRTGIVLISSKLDYMI